jgi:hypothetical protein
MCKMMSASWVTFRSTYLECFGTTKMVPFILQVLTALVLMAFATSFAPSNAKDSSEWIGSNSFGGTGLFQTRSARTKPDGHFEVGYGLVDPYKRYYMTLQGLPWLEGTFRYTEITNQLYSPFASFSGTQSFKDRGADITVRILEENKYVPAVSVTLQDGLGTGQYSGEYLTFSKRFYDIDFSAGLTWGYGASGSTIRNPLASLAESFKIREGGISTGGGLNVTDYFAGEEMAIFGGFAYKTPIAGLVFKFEYDPNDFQTEPSNSVLDITSHYNVGFNYRPFEWLETSFAVERGYQYSFRMTLRSNLHSDGMPKFDPPPQALKSRADVEKDLQNPEDDEEEHWPKWLWPGVGEKEAQVLSGNMKSDDTNKRKNAISQLFDAFSAVGLTIDQVELEEGISRFYVSGGLPDEEGEISEKVVKIVAQALPIHSDTVVLVDSVSTALKKPLVVLNRQEVEGERIVVDYLFEGLELMGLEFEHIDISRERVNLYVSQTAIGAYPNAHTADLLFKTLPNPVNNLTVHLASSGQPLKKFEFHKEDTEREVIVSELFETVEAEGLQVLSVSFVRNSTEITVLADKLEVKSRLVRAAKSLVSTMPYQFDDLTVIATHSGIEISRVKMEKARAGASSGEKWSIAGVNNSTSGPSSIPDWTEEDRIAISSRLFRELKKEGFTVEAVSLEGFRVTVYGSSRKFRFLSKNLGRAFRVIANNIPTEIEELSIITVRTGMQINEITIQRNEIEKATLGNGSVEEIWVSGEVENGSDDFFLPENAVRNKDRYPSTNWLINPKIRTHLGGPSQFLLYQFFITAGFDFQLMPGLNATGRLRRNIYNNFGKIKFGSSSVLPHVRTDIKEYLQETKDFSISRFQGDYFFKPVNDWYGRVSAGLFEGMFGGYGVEVLHRPFKSRFAVGVDVNKVWKRGFEQRFKFQDYTVKTGHLNLYYELPWKNISASAHIGQYLAGDRGITIQGSREFDSGVIFGLWSTFTDVPAEVFGEGSFDKGFYIRIPFDLFLTKSTTQKGTFAFRPITRDGGARLGMESRLYGIVTSANANRLVHHWDKFLD